MKPKKLVTAPILAAAAAMLLSSCAKEESIQSGLEPSEPEVVAPKVVERPRVHAEVADESSASSLGGLLGQRLIFFDYDKSAVKADDLGVLNAHADFLIINRGKTVVLEGHADERGSNEYNLALGLRRAEAVREIMVASGVYADQIETVSFGEERPLALGSDEEAWAENRRVRIVYSDE